MTRVRKPWSRIDFLLTSKKSFTFESLNEKSAKSLSIFHYFQLEWDLSNNNQLRSKNSQNYDKLKIFVFIDEMLTADRSLKTTFFWKKNQKKVGSSHLYASFGTFCIQIGQLFEAHWVFWKIFENCQIAVFEGKRRQFLILPKV